MNSHRQKNVVAIKHNRTPRNAKGFSMLELMISLVLGLILFAGILSIFVGMRATTAETSSFGELQENGRFAISVLTDDLLKQDFWGDFSGTFSTANLTAIPAAPSNDCVGEGVNNATFPVAIGNFRTLWGKTLTAALPDPLNCFSTPVGTKTKAGSDVIQIKRVIANPVGAAPLVAPTAGNFYLTTNTTIGGIVAFGGVTPVLDNPRTWQYQHHVYYVREEQVGNNFVPVLIQGRLANFSMNFTPIIDGIEVIRFMYGIGPEATGVVDRFISADDMTAGLWDKAAGTRILAVKIYVLARSILPDNKYENNNTYQLGAGDDGKFEIKGDNYRRLLFSSTVTLYNGRVDSW